MHQFNGQGRPPVTPGHRPQGLIKNLIVWSSSVVAAVTVICWLIVLADPILKGIGIGLLDGPVNFIGDVIAWIFSAIDKFRR